MSSIRYNQQSMNGIDTITDGIGTLEDGILNCEAVIASDYVETVHIRSRETLAVGNNVAVGNTISTQNIYANSFVSKNLDCKTIKVERIGLYNNLIVYDENNVGYIKKSVIKASTPLIRNISVSIVSLPLQIGVYVLSYELSIQVTANNTNIPLLYGLSSDGINLDVIQNKNVFSDVIFGNTNTYPILNYSMPYQVSQFGTTIRLLVRHNSTPVSNVLATNCRITALRIA